MRIVESESRQGSYFIVICGLIAAFFGFYIFTGILFVLLLLWLFFCSSRLINPTTPNAIVSPISGVIKSISYGKDCVEFKIKARFNGRIYAPSDLRAMQTKKYHGFYFLRQDKTAKQLAAKDMLEAQTTLENENLAIKIEVLPSFLRICGLHTNKLEALFLEKIGFLNAGVLNISVKGNNLKVLVKEKEHVRGGSSPIVTIGIDS